MFLAEDADHPGGAREADHGEDLRRPPEQAQRALLLQQRLHRRRADHRRPEAECDELAPLRPGHGP
jgi:hypothetical protein